MHNLWVEYDNLSAVQMANSLVKASGSVSAPVNPIRSLLQKDWHVKVDNVWRKANNCRLVIADFAFSFDPGGSCASMPTVSFH